VILDGFPRTAAQARALDEALEARGTAVEVAPYIEIDEDEMLRRLGGRWLCREQGHSYNTAGSPPRVEGICDRDGSALYQRDDDRPEVVRDRLAVQLPPLFDVIDHYDRQGKIVRVDGTRPIETVSDALLDRLVPAERAR
jgi:adenylate kinase